ncbi:MAG: hypothetical protein M0R74_08195 [Dehalococcoidia bacterium]|nr:hypothetical protein [Dehalococcoidia bacterium]
MQFALIFSGIVFPILFVVGTIGAWRKNQRENAVDATDWRDDSLDEWRRERDAHAIAERESRAESGDTLRSGGETEEVSERRHQRRLGG